MEQAASDDTEPLTPEETGPQRTCVATGEAKAKEQLLRFVLSPEGQVVFDVAERLPGRGVWVSADAGSVRQAVKAKRFARGFRQPVKAGPELVDQVAAGLRRRCLDWLALVNKSGLAVVGFSKVEPLVAAGKAALLLQADDAGSDSDKLRSAIQRYRLEFSADFTRAELGRAFGRDELVHIACKAGGATDKLLFEIRRMAGFSVNTAL